MAKCKTCGAPVNLAPDGDPRYEPPITRACKGHYELLEALEKISKMSAPGQDIDIFEAIEILADIYTRSSKAIAKAKGQDDG